ncbi:MAG: hypothetical protein V3U80_06230 [Flavobacteriaceae bacterium]
MGDSFGLYNKQVDQFNSFLKLKNKVRTVQKTIKLTVPIEDSNLLLKKLAIELKKKHI